MLLASYIITVTIARWSIRCAALEYLTIHIIWKAYDSKKKKKTSLFFKNYIFDRTNFYDSTSLLSQKTTFFFVAPILVKNKTKKYNKL